MNKIFTIGVFGSVEEEFFDAILKSQIDLFCDIRSRRVTRGRTYSFTNSKYLQKKLKELGISYLHLKELAPTPNIRSQQHLYDVENNIKKRSRTELSERFIDTYKKDILGVIDKNELMSYFLNVKNIMLFCVECHPKACHRSIVAEYLSNMYTNVQVENIILCKS
jgi:uncharacterized protein (DUF488 family)